MRRRDVIKALAAGTATLPSLAWAQSARVRRMGILLYAEQDKAVIAPFLRGLEALGYVDGKHLGIEYRDANADYDRVPQLIAELIQLNPELIFAFGGDLAPYLKRATSTIPLVVVVSNDPVESGLVASLGRPGGNITGVTYVHDMLAGKSIELLKDTVPSIARVAVLWAPTHTDPEFRQTQIAARTLSIDLTSLEVRKSEDFSDAFRKAIAARSQALIVFGSRFIARHRASIAEFVDKSHLILGGVPPWLIEAGALFRYGPNTEDLQRQAATYAAKIFKGARPADLPMQQPTRFELTLNLKTAQKHGITLPATLLALADEVIE